MQLGSETQRVVALAVQQADGRAREEERAAATLQREERDRQMRHAARESLSACATAVREAKAQLETMRLKLEQAETNAAVSTRSLASALSEADAELQMSRVAVTRHRETAAVARVAAGEAGAAAERGAGVSVMVLRRALMEADEHVGLEVAKGRAVAAALRESLAEARAKIRAAESSAASGLAEARQGRCTSHHAA